MTTRLPEFFRPIFWSYNFSKINPSKNKERIIVNTINYGNWEHWQWLFKYYGVKKIKETIEEIPASEFRQRVLKLIYLLLKIKKIKYATRGAKIRAEKSI